MLIQPRADFKGIGIDPFKWEGSALVGLYRVNAAEIVFGKPSARPVGPTFEN